MAVANKIFLGKGFSPKESFLSIVRKDFYSEVTEVNFANRMKAARDGKSVKNSTDEYFDLEIAHKMRTSQHITICAKTA